MACPKCGSNSLWDDMMAWGCNKCDFFTTGAVQNTDSSRDTFGWNPQPQPDRTPELRNRFHNYAEDKDD